MSTSGLFASGGLAGLSVTWSLIIAVALILVNGVFVAYEFALLAAKRSSFEAGAEQGKRVDRAAERSISDLSLQLAGAQFGITLATLGLGSVGEPALAVLFEDLLASSLSEDGVRVVSFVVALGIVSFLHLVIGEMVPKNIAISTPEPTVRWLVLPYRAYLVIAGPLVRTLSFLANGGTRLVGVEPTDEIATSHSTAELAAIVRESFAGGGIDDDSAEMLQGALDFAERPVRDIVRPLSETPQLRLGSTPAQAERLVRSSQETRIPVLTSGRTQVGGASSDGSGSIPGSIVGYLHAKDLLMLDGGGNHQPLPGSMTRPLARIHADRSLVQALRVMRQQKRQLAVVFDERGAIGVVSLEELVAALVADESGARTNN